jgi:adenine-specific DNA-methyltransferase
MPTSSIAYLGHKAKLVEWLEQTILRHTGWESLQGRFIADLFAGSGAVSAHFRSKGASTLSNDMERCSVVVTRALVCCQYTPRLASTIEALNQELSSGLHRQGEAGFMALNYSPLGNRAYWTEENARRMDYLRGRIEQQASLSEHDHQFLLASLVGSADRVKNCSGEYSRFLKNGFQNSALRELWLAPIHTNEVPVLAGAQCLRDDALRLSVPTTVQCVYLDPPYNRRQYSKHYFPLSLLAASPEEQRVTRLQDGVTGIPETDCYISPFSSNSAKTVAGALKTLIANQPLGCWVFLSYSSEGTLKKVHIFVPIWFRFRGADGSHAASELEDEGPGFHSHPGVPFLLEEDTA